MKACLPPMVTAQSSLRRIRVQSLLCKGAPAFLHSQSLLSLALCTSCNPSERVWYGRERAAALERCALQIMRELFRINCAHVGRLMH